MSENIHSVTSIGNYAGFKLRLIAHIIDMVILGILQIIVFLGLVLIVWLSQTARHNDYNFALQVMITIGLILCFLLFCSANILYFSIFESSKFMATPGKLALSLIVINTSGDRITFWRALYRNLAKLLSYLLLYFGFIMAAFTKKKQALHDMIASCLVVKKL